MYHKRRLGVKEGNAIDDIVAFEMKKERGKDEPDDYKAYCRACLVLGIERIGGTPIHPAFQGKVEASVKSGDQALPINYVVNPTSFKKFWWAFKVVGGLFLFWILGCGLLYVLGKAMFSLVSFAHP